MGVKSGTMAGYMIEQYQTMQKKAETDAVMNSGTADELLDEARIKLYDTSLYFARSFTAEITANRNTFKGKIKCFVQRVIRKLTKFIFIQFADTVYNFQYRALEAVGKMHLATVKQGSTLRDIQYEETKHQENISGLQEEAAKHQESISGLQEEAAKHQESIFDIQKDVEATKKQLSELQKMLNEQTILSFEVQKLRDLLAGSEYSNTGLQEKQRQILADEIHLNRDMTAGRNTGFPSFSQCGEDGILNYLLFVIFKRDPSSIRYLDIGCNDFRNDNNTYYMYLLGASGVVIDANPVCVESFQGRRPRDTVLNIGVGEKDEGELIFYVMNNYGLSTFSKEAVEDAIRKNPENQVEKEIAVPVLGINTVLEQYFRDFPLDVLSLDAEGIDEKILNTLDFDTYKPQIIIVETIDYAPWVVVEQKRAEIMDIMKEKGYVEFAFTGVNSIFIDPHMVR
ncbi:MAG: FkbM family methyltransferase [Oscillospiraceae bacterium]|nr:FkbM family methyltransferase [Oscillospiraceae bacterium]